MATSTAQGAGLDAQAFIRAKTDQAIEILREKGIDVWITYVRETMANADPTLELIFDGDLTWESALILTADGEKIAIVGVHDAPEVEEAEVYDRVIGYREGISEPLINTLTRLDPRAIAVNFSENDPLADGLGAGLHNLLRRRLEGTLFADAILSAEDVIWSLRGRKLPIEVDAIRRSCAVTEDVLREAIGGLESGVNALQLAASIRETAHAKGYSCAWTPKMCPLVTTGPGSRIGHVTPAPETIVPGSLVHVDFGVRVDGYCSDIQRMWHVSSAGEGPPEPVVHAFRTVVDAITRASEALKPGVQGQAVDEIARAHLKEQGFEEYQHALGHQLGRSPHDGGGATLAPGWERYNETPYRKVEAGNVFTLEPSILLPEHGLVSLEEVVLVTDDGCEFLTERQLELPVLHLPG